jgi:hypothetical protein
MLSPLIIFAVLFLLVLSWWLLSNYSDVVYIKSDIDQKSYMIRYGKNKSPSFLKESANTLATINQRIELLIQTLFKKWGTNPSKKYFLIKLKENYNPYMISEAAIDPRYTTYTVDKEDIHICLRTRDAYEKIYDINLLMYVVLHELAHLCNYNMEGVPIQGHGDSFKYIFKFLVQEAIELGVYTYTNYASVPQEYCGIRVNSSII